VYVNVNKVKTPVHFAMNRGFSLNYLAKALSLRAKRDFLRAAEFL